MCGWKPVRFLNQRWPIPLLARLRNDDRVYVRITDEVIGDIWPARLQRYAIARHPEDADRANRYARVQYKEITGQWPGRDGGGGIHSIRATYLRLIA